jgi:ABC-type nitrate/sulfonate/bicarbonate transport system substrate-binding protein
MEKKIIMATGHKHAYHRVSTLAAIENGYFRDEGLPDVELIATGEDHLTMEALRSGKIDFGADVKPGMVFEASSKGEPLYILGAMINGLPSTLIGTPDVKSIADLRGKKIGCKEEGGSREVPWIRMLLRKAGIDPDKEVEWVPHAGFGSLDIQKPRLDRGDYQAIGLTGHYKRPELFDLVREAGFNCLAECTETHPYGLPSRVIATRSDILAKYPEQVVKVLKGIIRGYRFARDKKNVEKIRHMYLSYDWGKDGFGWGKFDATLLDGQIASAQYLPPDGGVVEKGLQDIAEEYKAWGKLPQNFSYEQATRFHFVRQAALEVDAAYGAPEGY